jgi:hypothetical protein
MKIHNTANGECLVAACDTELLGKTFKEGKLKIEVSPSFYGDMRVNEETFITTLNQATISNLLGKFVIDCAKRAGHIDETHVIMVAGIPHIQIIKF